MPVMDVDTALQTIGYGFGQVIIFIVCFFTYMYSVSEAMSVSYIVVLTSCEFATTAGEKTLLANSLLGGMVASGLFVGMLADKYGRKFTLRLALIGALGFSMLSALMPNLYALSITRMIVGLFLSAVASLQVAFLTEFHTPKWRPLAVTLCSQSQSMALIYCPLVAMAILPHHFTVTLSSQFDMRPWRFLMMAVEIPGWIALVGICLVPETPYFLLSINNGEKAILALKWICRKNRKNWEDFDIILAENERATVVPEGFFSSFLYDSFRLFRKPYFTKFFICLMLIFGLFFNWLSHIQLRWHGHMVSSYPQHGQ
ncbi:putative transporter SVOPL isoform X2 [Drosophila eugracilis]|uniref:putative transporter SVOPL isoform X2 n=1 Tax=Drosophila eugracilis TaxID=29029 RepID=UPI0007E7DF58|nr:putative transporter SVOPL isoform X2 [Drosophila eugracilis]